MEFEKNVEIIDLEELTQDSNIIDESVGCGFTQELIVSTYTKGMSMLMHWCRRD